MLGWIRKWRVTRHGDGAALADKDAALAAVFDTGTAGIAEIDLTASRFVRVNNRCCEILRRDAATLLRTGPGGVIPLKERERILLDYQRAIWNEGRWDAEVRHVDPQGEEFWVRVGVSVSKRDARGRPIRCVAVLQDVSESRAVSERLRHSEELLRLGQRIGRIGTFERDLRTGKLFCSAETRLMFGLAPQARVVGGAEWLPCFTPEAQPRIAEAIRAALARRDEEIAVEASIRRADDGALRHLEMRARYFYDANGEPVRSVGVVIDVTERRLAEEKLAHAAQHDPLTGLGNRSLFREALSAACASGEGFAVLCLDLDRFKDVNDTFGHPAGDRLLVETAARLARALGPRDTLARLGGDEFAVLRRGVSDPDDAGRLAGRLVEAVRPSFALAGQRVRIGASVGVAVSPRDGRDGDDLLGAADLALYQAKSDPGGWRFYAPHMDREAERRCELESDLRRALDADQFELFYQPVLDLPNLRARRFEALIRWRHPTRGLVPPDRFIPICEATGLITEVGAWVLRRACLDAARWPDDIGVSVNISAVQIVAGTLEANVAEALRESGLSADRLELEITETSLLAESSATLAALHRLKAMGVGVAMDDFGAGHSSLGYLQRFPFDKVKIDRALTRGVEGSPKAAAIFKATLALCDALGLSVTIEGVETEAQFQALAQLGGDKVQGYLFSPPQPSARVPELLARFGASEPPRCEAA